MAVPPAACRTRLQPPPASVPRGTRATVSPVQVQPLHRPRALSTPFRSSLCPLWGLTLPLAFPVLPCAAPGPCCPPPPALLIALCACLPLAVDPCARDHGGCSPHANCTTVAPGQRTCTCLDGYTGDGELCQGEAGVPHQG